MNYQKFSLVFGFSIFLIATLIVRFWGQYIFIEENNLIIGSLYLGTLPALYFLVTGVFNRFKLNSETQLRSSILMALPAMLCDTFCIKFHAIVFPLLTVEQSILLGSWVLWVYSFTILIGFIFKGGKETA